jgi:hypothetical protein
MQPVGPRDWFHPVHITLPLSGVLEAAERAACWQVPRCGRLRLLECQVFLQDTGSGDGATEIDVLREDGLSGVARTVLPVPIRIMAASDKGCTRLQPTSGLRGEPPGVPFNPGDVIRIDVRDTPSVPSGNGYVVLTCLGEEG